MHLGAPTRFCKERLARLPWRKAFLSLSAVSLLSLLACRSAAAQAPAPPDIPTELQHTKELLREPVSVGEQFDYIMTARVRLLLFWAGKDDVGGGYIRRGSLSQDPAWDVIELLIGSDPAKAPRAINRWGAASEISHKPDCCDRNTESGIFFGFMKVSNGASFSEMEKELSHEKNGSAFLFSAIINQGDRNTDYARLVPFTSDTDFTINQLDQAKSMVFARLLGSDGLVKYIPANQLLSCGRREGFLKSVADLVDDAVQEKGTPVTLCYLYNGEAHQITLDEATRVPSEVVHLSLHDAPHDYIRTYHDLVLAHFTNFNQTTTKKSDFELLLGTTGALKGVPVQIRYQPNWWFQVLLNLKTPESSGDAQKQSRNLQLPAKTGAMQP
jgi:hypothetical protein